MTPKIYQAITTVFLIGLGVLLASLSLVGVFSGTETPSDAATRLAISASAIATGALVHWLARRGRPRTVRHPDLGPLEP